MNPNSVNTKQEAKKQWIRFGLLLGGVCAGIYLLIVLMHQNNADIKNKAEDKPKLETPLLHVNDGSVVLEKAQKRAKDAETKASELEQKLNEVVDNQTKAVDEMQKRMEAMEKNLQVKTDNNLNDPLLGLQGGTLSQNLIKREKLNLTPETELQNLPKRPSKNPDTYVPAGTFVQGVIIEGADASAAVTAQSAPEPMLIKLIADGTLPNKRHSHLKGCTIILAASGDISSERGKIRTERLSCVKSDGQIIEIKVEGNVAGPDGKNGMRGNPVWRENKLLQRAFTAGALSGLSEGISQTYTTNSISPLGNTQTTESSKILQVGAARGTGKALDKLADYNIQRAEQYHPVIQLSAGTVVDVVFLEGFYLDGKKHSENEDAEIEVKTMAAQSHPFFESDQNSQSLPLTPQQVARLDEHSKELGLTVRNES